MIEFQINDEKQYLVWWDEEYEELYFLIEPVTPVIVFSEKDELHLEENNEPQIFRIQKSRIKKMLKLPNLKRATYRFALYDNELGKGDPLKKEERYFGNQENLDTFFEEYGSGFIRWKAVCKYKIPKDLFWLSLKNAKANDAGGRFYLPPMSKCKGGFETSCLLKKGAEDKIKLCLDNRISNSIHI